MWMVDYRTVCAQLYRCHCWHGPSKYSIWKPRVFNSILSLKFNFILQFILLAALLGKLQNKSWRTFRCLVVYPFNHLFQRIVREFTHNTPLVGQVVVTLYAHQGQNNCYEWHMSCSVSYPPKKLRKNAQYTYRYFICWHIVSYFIIAFTHTSLDARSDVIRHIWGVQKSFNLIMMIAIAV